MNSISTFQDSKTSISTANLCSNLLSSDHRKIVSPNHCSFRNGLTTHLYSLHPSCSSVKAMAAEENLGSQSSSSSYTKKALISVSDETDIGFLGRGLQSLGYTVVSTRGTVASLERAGVLVTKAEDFFGFPELFDGRIKYVHPYIHDAILARRDLHHMEALDVLRIDTFDIVVANLYPFYEKVSSVEVVEFEDVIENIDIGDFSLITGAAQSKKHVLVVVDSQDYPELLEFLKGNQEDSQQFRQKLASKAIQYADSFKDAVSKWMWMQCLGDKFLPSLNVSMDLVRPLHYGDNPHKNAALYVDKSLVEVNGGGGIATAVQHYGANMSYSNYLDADVAWNCVMEFKSPTCVIVKHENPCGVASCDDILAAYRLAVKGDHVSAFGGTVAFNVAVDEALAKEIQQYRNHEDGETHMLYEVVVAPKYTKKGLDILGQNSKIQKILEAKKNEEGKLSFKKIGGGMLVRHSDDLAPEDTDLYVVSKRKLQAKQLSDVEFAWLCAKHAKSNAIVITKEKRILGVGVGQLNHVDNLRLALKKAGDEVNGATLASDALFPFDAMEEACQSGISVIVEPGGSIRDWDAIECCDQYGVALIFTYV